MSYCVQTCKVLYKFIFTKESATWAQNNIPASSHDFLNTVMRSYQSVVSDDDGSVDICIFAGEALGAHVFWIPEQYLTRIYDK
jgi:hypothetical protein